ncbi:DUF4124 domain-containing protein [Ottowia thiooxydans]|uniref:DUF4124 domain-containing protein n=1 Tax=Ottowia thiooxydans TaxID=219182 RepID=A0ABV2QBT9_9BURK
MKTLTLIAASLFAAPAFSQVYKCPNANGRVVIQQAPCAGGDKLDVRPASGQAPAMSSDVPASMGKPASEADRINARTDASQRERWKIELENRAVPDADMAIANGRRECQAQAKELESRGGSANNNLAGATYLQSVALQMQALATRCDTQERTLRDNYDRLLRECKQLSGCAGFAP